MSDRSSSAPTALRASETAYDAASALSASVLIVCWNGLDHLRTCLPTVLDQDYPQFEVLVLDNASSDGSPEWVEQTYGDRVRLIRTGANLGYVGANNLGFELATGDVLVVLTPDTQVAPGWLRGLVGALAADPSVGLATAMVCHYDQREVINTCGNDIHLTGMAFCRHLDQPTNSFTAIEEVSGVSGANFAMRRSLWQRIGGFDTLFFMYMEDTDLSLRVHLAGYRVVATPNATIYHKYDINMRPAKYFWMERNRLVLLLKNFRAGTLLLLAPALALTEAMVWGFAVLRGPDYLRAKARSYAWLATHRSEIAARRRRTQALRRVSDRTLLRTLRSRIALGQLSRSPVARALVGGVANPLFRAWRAALTRVLPW